MPICSEEGGRMGKSLRSCGIRGLARRSFVLSRRGPVISQSPIGLSIVEIKKLLIMGSAPAWVLRTPVRAPLAAPLPRARTRAKLIRRGRGRERGRYNKMMVVSIPPIYIWLSPARLKLPALKARTRPRAAVLKRKALSRVLPIYQRLLQGRKRISYSKLGMDSLVYLFAQ